MPLFCCGNNIDDTIIAKRNSQLGHLEEHGLTRCPPPRLRAEETAIPVILNVYSLLEKNAKLAKIGMGVFHTGVVVCGIEWSYGEVLENPEASGLFCVHPGQAAGSLYRTVKLGHTTKSPTQIDTILHRLENEWRSAEYHILHHNCNHFSQAFCNLLSTVEKLEVPPWCNRAARAGDRIIPRKLATKIQRMCDEEVPKAKQTAPKSNVGELPVSVIPRGWYLHPSVAQPPRYVHIFSSDEEQEAAAAGEASESVTITRISTDFTTLFGNDDVPPPPGYTAAESANMVIEISPNLVPNSQTSALGPPLPRCEVSFESAASANVSVSPSPVNTARDSIANDVHTHELHMQHAVDSPSAFYSTAAMSEGSPLLGHRTHRFDCDEYSTPLPISSVEMELPTERGDFESGKRHTKGTMPKRNRKKRKEEGSTLETARRKKSVNPDLYVSQAINSTQSSSSDAAISRTESNFTMSRDVSIAAFSATESVNYKGSKSPRKSSPDNRTAAKDETGGVRTSSPADAGSAVAKEHSAAPPPEGSPSSSGTALRNVVNDTVRAASEKLREEGDNGDHSLDGAERNAAAHCCETTQVLDENSRNNSEDTPLRRKPSLIATAAPTPVTQNSKDDKDNTSFPQLQKSPSARMKTSLSGSDFAIARGDAKLPVLRASAHESPTAQTASSPRSACALPLASERRPTLSTPDTVKDGRRLSKSETISPLSQSFPSVSATQPRLPPAPVVGGQSPLLPTGSVAKSSRSPTTPENSLQRTASVLSGSCREEVPPATPNSGSFRRKVTPTSSGGDFTASSGRERPARARTPLPTALAKLTTPHAELSLLQDNLSMAEVVPYQPSATHPGELTPKHPVADIDWNTDDPLSTAGHPKVLHMDPSRNGQDLSTSDPVLGQVPSSAALHQETTLLLPHAQDSEVEEAHSADKEPHE